MRIIKAARLQTEREETCYYCKSILGITKEDLQWNDMHWCFRCAVCGKYTQYATKNKDDLFEWIMEDQNDRQLPSGDTVREYSL